jgi:anhydro-N-acetylmuramic acid kinase
MPRHTLRYDPSHADGPQRTAIGISVASSCQAVRAALVDVAGRGFPTRVVIRSTVCLPIADSLVARLRKLVGGTKAEVPVETFGQLQAELAEIEVEAIQKLSAEAALMPGKILVAGIDDPGLWCTAGPHPYYLPLSDPARVAETSGLSVVDGFPARDLAQGGQGGPIGALPQWILLKHPQENRLLVDLGRTTRMSLLPSDLCFSASSRILSFDVGPGTWLLDELTAKLTGGRHRFDPGGRFAVQGRRLDALVDHWLADYSVSRTSPRWHPRGIRPERFLNEAIQMAVDAKWSVQDILCSATHLIAELIARTARERLADDMTVDRILITGGGQHNGMLLREIAARLPGISFSRIAELGIAYEALSPACAALLALFHLDQVPGNVCSVTGAGVPRVLGRLTPGSPQGWQRLLYHMAGAESTLRPLRSAL